MPSTLPRLEAIRLDDGTVELYDGARLVRRYLEWHPDRPSRADTVIMIENRYHRLTWKSSNS